MSIGKGMARAGGELQRHAFLGSKRGGFRIDEARMRNNIGTGVLQLKNGDFDCIAVADGNGEAIIAELRAKHAAFFAQSVRMAAPAVRPPVPTGGALTREDISRMSADEINRNWNAVKGVLAKGAI